MEVYVTAAPGFGAQGTMPWVSGMVCATGTHFGGSVTDQLLFDSGVLNVKNVGAHPTQIYPNMVYIAEAEASGNWSWPTPAAGSKFFGHARPHKVASASGDRDRQIAWWTGSAVKMVSLPAPV